MNLARTIVDLGFPIFSLSIWEKKAQWVELLFRFFRSGKDESAVSTIHLTPSHIAGSLHPIGI